MGTDIDGRGWAGAGRYGDAESRQREADKARTEKLYMAEEYGLFFLTAQQGSGDDYRKAYISVTPFHWLDAEKLGRLKAQATPWDKASSQVWITPRDPQLEFYDEITKTKSTIAIGELDPGVRLRLRFSQAAGSAWEKYAAPTSSAPEKRGLRL